MVLATASGALIWGPFFGIGAIALLGNIKVKSEQRRAAREHRPVATWAEPPEPTYTTRSTGVHVGPFFFGSSRTRKRR